MKHRWLLVLACFCLIGVSACSNDPDDEAIVGDLADEWVAGWSAGDPDAVAAVFTEDGTLIDPTGRRLEGRDAIADYVERHDNITDEECEDEVTATENGTFTVPCRFAVSGEPRTGDLEIELDGDLASQIQWLNLR